MFWTRLAIFGVPIVLVWLGLETFRGVQQVGPRVTEGAIVSGWGEEPDTLNPYLAGNAPAERVKRCLYDRLLEPSGTFELGPGLASSWDMSSTAKYIFVSELHAQEGVVAITEAQERWEEWGLLELQAERDSVRVRFKDPGGTGAAEVFALLDAEAVVPVKRVKVHTLQSAWQSFLDFRSRALERNQIRGEWRESDTQYELAVAGVTGDLLAELRNYYESNESLGATFEVSEEVPYLEEPELLLTLREGVRWHDGEPLTAEDVVFSYEACLEQRWGERVKESLEWIHAVVAVDARRVRVGYRKLRSTALEAWALLPVLPKHLLSGVDEAGWEEFFERGPVGTGPFRMLETTSGERLVLERNADYYLGAPETERLVFLWMPRGIERRLRFLSGEIETYVLERGKEVPSTREERFEALPTTVGRQTILVWHAGRPPFAESAVRRALAGAVEVDALIAEASPGTGEISCGLFYEASGYTRAKEEKLTASEGKGAGEVEARSALAQAGWEVDEEGFLARGGERLQVRLAVEEGEGSLQRAAGYLKRVWEGMGVEVDVRPLAGKAEVGEEMAFPAAEADALLISVPMATNWVSFRHGRIWRLLMRLASEEGVGGGAALGLMGRLEGAEDEEGRMALYGELEDLLMREGAIVCLFRERKYRVFSEGEYAISEGIGDGHRVTRELEESVVAGIDYYFPWWVKK